MEIGEPKEVREIEPVTVPVPEPIGVPEPIAVPEPTPRRPSRFEQGGEPLTHPTRNSPACCSAVTW